MTQNEMNWRAEFEKYGERAINHIVFEDGMFDEPKRQFAISWLREQEKAREDRELRLQHYTRLTFWAAIAAALVGILGIIVTWVH